MSVENSVTRRAFLGGALCGAALLAGGEARAAGSAPRLTMIIDLNRCTGCQSCVLACRAALDIPGHFRTCVDHGEDREKARAVFRPRLCNQCHPAACIKACPSKALAYGEDGVVRVNAAKCTGCRSCEKACPYGAIFVDRAFRKAFKCEYCQDGVHSVPACVEACASGARLFGDADKPEGAFALALQKPGLTSPGKGEKGAFRTLYVPLDGGEKLA